MRRRDVRSVRGGPVPARLNLLLLLLALGFVSGVFSFGALRDSHGDDARPVEEAVASAAPDAASYETATARVTDLSDRTDLPEVSSAGVSRQPATAAAATPAASPPAVARERELIALARRTVLDVDTHDGAVPVDALPAYEAAGGHADATGEASLLQQGVVEGRMEAGQTLSAALRNRGVSAKAVHVIARELRPIFDFRRARPGQQYRLVRTPSGDVLDFHYTIDRDESVRLWLTESGEYRIETEAADLVPRVTRMAGVVTSTLYEAMKDLGEDPALANDFAAVFAWEFDFTRNTRPGDEFQLLYERLYRPAGDGRDQYVRPGRILAARYRSGERELEAIRFDPKDGRGGFYRPDGTSVERQFLSAPLDYTRISSGYSEGRWHPILKVRRPHHGIDFAAPRGTPVWAVADGTVIYRARAGGFGNLIKVRHSNGYVSYYSHLDHFASGLHVGQKVSQKEVIGYVGSTGLATGPHTCFRIARNGRYINPFHIQSPVADPISASSWAAFTQQRDHLVADLDGGGKALASVEVEEAL